MGHGGTCQKAHFGARLLKAKWSTVTQRPIKQEVKPRRASLKIFQLLEQFFSPLVTMRKNSSGTWNLLRKRYFKVKKELGTFFWKKKIKTWRTLAAIIGWGEDKWYLCGVGRFFLFEKNRKWSAGLIAIIGNLLWKGGEPSWRMYLLPKEIIPSIFFVLLHENVVCFSICKLFIFNSAWWLLGNTITECCSLSFSFRTSCKYECSKFLHLWLPCKGKINKQMNEKFRDVCPEHLKYLI